MFTKTSSNLVKAIAIVILQTFCATQAGWAAPTGQNLRQDSDHVAAASGVEAALIGAPGAAAATGWQRLKIPGGFMSNLARFGLTSTDIEFTQIYGEALPIGASPVDEIKQKISLEILVAQALAGWVHSGTGRGLTDSPQTKSLKDEGDGNAVTLAIISLEELAHKYDVCIIVLGNEGKDRDKAPAIKVGRVFNPGGKNGVLLFVNDAIECTNNMFVGNVDSYSFVAFADPGTPFEWDGYRCSVNYRSDTPVRGIDPIIKGENTVEAVLRKIAEAEGYPNTDEAFGKFCQGHKVILLSRGRHNEAEEQAKRLSKQFGLAYTSSDIRFKDGDCMPRIITALGLEVDDRKPIVLLAGGGIEHLIGMLAAAALTSPEERAALQEGEGQYSFSVHMTKEGMGEKDPATSLGGAGYDEADFTEKERGQRDELDARARDINNELGPRHKIETIVGKMGDLGTVTTERDIPGSPLVGASSITGVRPDINGQKMAELLKKVELDKDGNIVVHILIVYDRRAYVFRATLKTDDVSQTRGLIRITNDFVMEQDSQDVQDARSKLEKLEEESLVMDVSKKERLLTLMREIIDLIQKFNESYGVPDETMMNDALEAISAVKEGTWGSEELDELSDHVNDAVTALYKAIIELERYIGRKNFETTALAAVTGLQDAIAEQEGFSEHTAARSDGPAAARAGAVGEMLEKEHVNLIFYPVYDTLKLVVDYGDPNKNPESQEAEPNLTRFDNIIRPYFGNQKSRAKAVPLTTTSVIHKGDIIYAAVNEEGCWPYLVIGETKDNKIIVIRPDWTTGTKLNIMEIPVSAFNQYLHLSQATARAEGGNFVAIDANTELLRGGHLSFTPATSEGPKDYVEYVITSTDKNVISASGLNGAEDNRYTFSREILNIQRWQYAPPVIARAEGNPLLRFKEIGQQIWLDGLTLDMFTDGTFEELVRDHGITGVTTNPTLIKAYLKDENVHDKAKDLARQGLPADKVYYELIKDLASTVIEVFKKHNVKGKFSVELDPTKADDAEASVGEAMRWTDIAPEYMMVKVAATDAGNKIIEEVTARGRNVNATLIFTPKQYEQVAEAYIRGLKRTAEAGHNLANIYSVASFFVSRWDVRLYNKVPNEHQGMFANSVTIAAYNDIFRRLFVGNLEFEELKRKGAKVQDFLLASTGSKADKMPEPVRAKYPADVYVSAVQGPNVVNTLPIATIKHLKTANIKSEHTIITNADRAQEVLGVMQAQGIDIDAEGKALLREGMESFVSDFVDVQQTIEGIAAEEAARAGAVDKERRMKASERAAVVIATDDTVWLRAHDYLKATGMQHVVQVPNEEIVEVMKDNITQQTGIPPDRIVTIDTTKMFTEDPTDLQGLGYMDEKAAMTRLNAWLDTQKLTKEAVGTGA